MMLNNSFKFLILLVMCALIVSGCKTDSNTNSNANYKQQLNIHLAKDPGKLHPIYNARTVAREVYQYIHVQLADYHPETMEMYPILIEDIPKPNDERENLTGYEIRILEDAVWGDGKPVIAEDYVFTIKAALHPATMPRIWKSFFSNIKEIEISPDNPKHLTVFVDDSFMLKLETAIGFVLLPKHTYAHADVLDKLDMKQIMELDPQNLDDQMKLFVEDFDNEKHFTTATLGAGPYSLKTWNTDQNLLLTAKEDYWGGSTSSNPFLNSEIDTLAFKIIGDEMAALTAFKDGAIDVGKGYSVRNYDDLKAQMTEASYDQVQTMRFFYIALNNNNPILKDVQVRKALNLLVDVDQIIQAIEKGHASPIDGPIHNTKPYYVENDAATEYDPTLALETLNKAGWKDSNNDGVLDKMVDGKQTELNLDILITGSELGKNIALIFKNEAEKVGVNIEITPKDIRRMLNENIYNNNYDMAALVESQDSNPDDLYPRWHSDNIKEKGSNLMAYSSSKVDSLIERIRQESVPSNRFETYKEFQRIMHQDYPCIFLYSPKEKFAFGAGIEGSLTPKRPGYLANTFKAKVQK